MFARPKSSWRRPGHKPSLDCLRERARTTATPKTDSNDVENQAPFTLSRIRAEWTDSPVSQLPNQCRSLTSAANSPFSAAPPALHASPPVGTSGTLEARIARLMASTLDLPNTHSDLVALAREQSACIRAILALPHRTDQQRQTTLRTLRHFMYQQFERGQFIDHEIRSVLWKLTLAVESVSAADYIRWVEMGPSSLAVKIKHDTPRTLATDEDFLGRVEEDQLCRVLNAFVWKSEEQTHGTAQFQFAYVPGMNVLAAPFLYIMDELDAFYALNTLLHRHCPTYVQPTLIGVHAGLTLLDMCLKYLDYPLYLALRGKGLRAELYAFPAVLTLSAGTPPLQQVIRLWDFYFAYGVHLNVVCIVAQLIGIRDTLMSSASLVRKTTKLVSHLPKNLFDSLVYHTYDLETARQFGNKAMQR
ncbi:CDC16 protein [Tieghemiomyces parasiticus]|uniref:CDC16 protein n=1 Tax=Tieghemiomyces parasiticus TaxID=78921 RepID=A0A9W8AF02_9FUNG|nr:CDC16 protein [Tieghemiomyces parasiticus]